MKFHCFLFALLLSSSVLGQDDSLLDMLEEDETPQPVSATFKGTRIVTGHSVETDYAGVFNLKIQHRFGTLNGGLYELFGLDQAYIRIGGDLGITNRISVGFGRSSYQKVYDGFVKVKLLQQKTKGFPMTVTFLQSMAIQGLKWQDTSRINYFSSRFAYCTQLMFARKFNENFSLQLTPTLIHRNLVKRTIDQNDVWAVGIGFRQKLSRRLSVNGEYYWLLPGQTAKDYYNMFALGFDIETGGHVFQIQFTNARQMIEKGFVAETTGSWLKGDIHLGFNISRVFNVYKPHPKK